MNKAGGVYGILSIITGHPLNFWQWLYNILAIFTLPFYISALIHLRDKPRNVRKLSLATIVYVLDTAIGIFYTLYFIYFWFSLEDVSSEEIEKRAEVSSALSSQSASIARELYVTLSTTIVISAIRIYFTMVIVSFTRALLKQDVNENRYNDSSRTGDDDDEQEVNASKGVLGEWKKFVFELEIKSKEVLTAFFRG